MEPEGPRATIYIVRSLSVPTLPATPSGDVAVRPLPDLRTEALLRSILRSIDDGVLLTDLDHRSLACNRRFGEIFGVDPDEVIRMGIEELRARVVPLIVNQDAWLMSLEEAYADPERRFEDEITLRRGSVDTIVRRVANPVHDPEGRLLGRLWTFSDVTETHRRRRNSDLLRTISMLADPDPAVNLRAVCEAVTVHFGAATQINIAEGDFLRFHLNAGDLGPAQHLPGIPKMSTYCGYTLEDDRTLMVQDARENPRFSGLLPASVGYCRYLGVPVRDEAGRAIGTLCIIDQQMDTPLTDADVEMMELVAMRANAELARERFLAERMAQKDREFSRKRLELEETRLVLGSMNDAFALLFEVRDTPELLRRLSALLRDVLGYSASAVFLRRSGEARYAVAVAPCGARPPELREADLSHFPGLDDCATNQESRDVRALDIAGTPLAELLGLDWAAVACLPGGEWGEAVVVLGRETAPPLGSARHAVGLSAIADGVRIVLSAHALNDGIAQAREKALRSEKLAVVGTLAASTAHDIRNITASLSMLAADTGDPVGSLTAVREQLDRFSVLAHRLLSYARPGQTALETVDVPEMLERALALTAGQRRVSAVEATLGLAPDLPTIQGDGNQLQHLFVNLALNAIQAMERKGGHLRLEASVEDGRMRVRVVDDGPGIPASVADRLFQPFASSRAQGFGLGLYSARRIAEAHGGGIAALKNPEGGTTMQVELALDGGAR